MFRDVLRDVVENAGGGVAGLLMGYDGIAVEHYVKDDGPLDVETIGMEYSVILKEIRRAADSLDAGAAREVMVCAEKLTTIVRMLTEEYFIALALAPNGNVGKGRYLLRQSAPKLLAELE